MRCSVIGLGVLLFLPGFSRAESPITLECSAGQTLPGRMLVCEYTMLESRNAELADLYERVVHAGRARRIETKRWLATRDACRDVECLDQLYEEGMREARLALVEVESRTPAPILTNARGEVLRVVETATRPIVLPHSPPPASPVREPAAAIDTAGSLLMVVFLVAALGYSLVARRLTA